jgi:hypothetical protein
VQIYFSACDFHQHISLNLLFQPIIIVITQQVYLTSTKMKKMSITAGVVDHIHTQLSPPGRFLEKDLDTGRWKEVDMKRAHEKTAQALRDGASLLRKSKRSSDEMTSTNSSFLVDDNTRAFKKPRRPAATTPAEAAVSISTELCTNLPKKEEEEEEEEVLHMSTGTGFPCSTSSASLMSMDQWLPMLELPVLELPAVSPLELSRVTPSQSPVYPSPAPVDEFGSLFYMTDPKENEAPMSDVVDISDEEIFLHWITC